MAHHSVLGLGDVVVERDRVAAIGVGAVARRRRRTAPLLLLQRLRLCFCFQGCQLLQRSHDSNSPQYSRHVNRIVLCRSISFHSHCPMIDLLRMSQAQLTRSCFLRALIPRPAAAGWQYDMISRWMPTECQKVITSTTLCSSSSSRCLPPPGMWMSSYVSACAVPIWSLLSPSCPVSGGCSSSAGSTACKLL